MTKEFGQWLEAELESREWGPTRAAREMGVSHSMVSQWIDGLRNPGARSVGKIAQGLNMDPEVVMEAAGLLPPGDNPDPSSRYARALGLVNSVDWETDASRLELLEGMLKVWITTDRKLDAELEAEIDAEESA